jgi:hypothetical protein
MPARCTTCGEQALTDDAQFCVGCGAALEPVAVPVVEIAPEPPSPEPPSPTPRPRRARPVRPPRRRIERSVTVRPVGGPATVPPTIVAAAVIALLAILLLLLLVG